MTGHPDLTGEETKVSPDRMIEEKDLSRHFVELFRNSIYPPILHQKMCLMV
jgi:hypothetical protein